MKLKSRAFQHEGNIPERYSCDGDNINPPLEIEEVPSNAKSLVLIMDDPDVPEFVRKDRMFVHWVIYDMPKDIAVIDEDSTPQGKMGKGTSGEASYFGPCPPDREHRYYFKLYALDKMLNLAAGATKQEVEKAMAGHIIANTELMGRYERRR
ncbi:MAG TPA: YbhB/YbcL family Raf kinase inhibitor-like protein [Rhabdochlamydiaceae bacterium]|nr:YbhB/YbcL family Raf kinase inhibitor-like protein [Rhabdochlamydiaceae bacterium]